ncbi:hypothetical protein ACU5AX_07840 [Sphingomonas sp. XXL09]|uniref:hypothetical protein n=1 Tax=Sphingomonas sp. XXL09 TaxID=3457787 RepID=UPI00406BCFD3
MSAFETMILLVAIIWGGSIAATFIAALASLASDRVHELLLGEPRRRDHRLIPSFREAGQ